MRAPSFLLVLLAGVLNGSFAVPMKWTRNWAWENVWLAWSLIGLLIFPFALTTITVPRLAMVYESEPLVSILVFACGLVWGVSQIFFGLGISRIGIGLGFAIVISMAAVTGSLVPLLRYSSVAAQALSGSLFATGIIFALVGVALCSVATLWRGNASKERSGNAKLGLLFCVGAGIGGAMVNVGMVAGGPLAQTAGHYGAQPLNGTNAIWLPLLFAGFVSTALYCAMLLTRNGKWSEFWSRQAGWYWVLASLMAFCWFGSVALYGIGAAKLGPAGPILGWPIFLCASIITANVWSAVVGEWRHAAWRANRLVALAIAVLVISIFVLASARV